MRERLQTIVAHSLKDRLAGAGHAFGTMLFEFFTPDMPTVVAATGANFILLDGSKAALPFIVALLTVALLVIFVPGVATWLPCSAKG